jgi:hypothetical protein
MSNALVALNDMERMAQAIAASGLFGMKTKEQALALMIVAQSENRHPGSVAAEYHIIQGRPALKADAMLARFQLAGGLVEWVEYTDKKVSGKFSHSVNSPTPVLIEWTIEMATKAGLAGKDNWKNYPRQMLRARVVSEGVRTVYPAVCVGVYTPEEVQDFEPAERPKTRKEKEINPLPAGNESTGGIPSSTAGTPPAASGAPVETRTETLRRLCNDAHMAVEDILAKVEVQSAEEMSDPDWNSAMRMLNKKLARMSAAA